MLNNGHKKQTCGFADEIVAYIYDEIDRAERTKFESHLAGCAVCTDEFAGLSNARFSVFEWRREEFAHLATPEIDIPYPAKQSSAATDVRAGFLDGVRELLTLAGWSSVVAVAVALVVCIGLGFVAMNYLGGSQQIANDLNKQIVPPVETQNTQIATVSPEIASKKEINPTATTTNTADKTTTNREIRPVRASVANQRPGFGKNLTASNQTPGNTAVNGRVQPKRKAPALTEYADDGDKSLRLADLFDEVGSKR